MDTPKYCQPGLWATYRLLTTVHGADAGLRAATLLSDTEQNEGNTASLLRQKPMHQCLVHAE
jgi:hypothetical protein